MSAASDYLNHWIGQYQAGTVRVGITYTEVQHGNGWNPGITGYATSRDSQLLSTPLNPMLHYGFAFSQCPQYFSDRADGGTPFSGHADTIDLSLWTGTATRGPGNLPLFYSPDGHAHLSIRNETWGGTITLTTDVLDAATQQLIFQVPGAGNVPFPAMGIVSLYPVSVPG